jgi:hypothetical protein
MPDGPRYDDDFYAWTQYQAEVLRSVRIRDNRFDRENVAEEIEDLGKNYRDAVRSTVRRILEHLLKLAHSPATDPRADRMMSIAEARDALKDQMTPTLRHDVETMLERLYQDACHHAEIALYRFGEAAAAVALPAACPYSLDHIVEDRWYPDPPKDST